MKQRFAPLFFYYIILAVLGIIILRWLVALAAPGKRLSLGGSA
jgi:hypothetical protein